MTAVWRLDDGAVARPALMANPSAGQVAAPGGLAGSPYPKAELLPRCIARLFDLMVCGGLIALSRQAGAVAGAFYLLTADALFRGQSPGKRLMGLKVMHLPTLRPAGARLSALRNYPMALLGLLALDTRGGWSVLALGSALVLGYEGYRVVTDPLGIRQGDQLAQTQVVDGKVVAGQGFATSLPQRAMETGDTRMRSRWEPPRRRSVRWRRVRR